MEHAASSSSNGSEPSGVANEEPNIPERTFHTGLQSRLKETRALTWSDAAGKLIAARDKSCIRVQRALGKASTRLPPTPFGALCGVADALPVTAENVLLGYAQGLYPMEFGGKLRWNCPDQRFLLYLSELRITSNMRRELRRKNYATSFDRAPREVLDACGEREEGTWLSERLKEIYMQLFELGALHTVEAWQDDQLVGGSFGVSIGRIWTSESMFHRAPHAGKVQFAAVAAHLVERGYECVDGQLYSEHFARFGAREVPIDEYRRCLARGLANPTRFHAASEASVG